MPDVKEILAAYLEEHGYDGLFNDDCACALEDLAPCGEIYLDCEAGYKVPCTCGEEHDFHIARETGNEEGWMGK